MLQAIVPLYLDWTFWAVVVAVLALILSQLPPIHQILRSGKLTMELYSRVSIMHKIGNPNVQLHFLLSNIGGRTSRVKSVSLTLRRDKKEVAVLPAQTYLQEPGDTSPLLFTSFSIKPKEEWAHIVAFLNFFARADEKKYRAAELVLKSDILTKRALPKYKDQVVETDDEKVRPFVEMFDEKFIWHPGEYEMQVRVESPARKVLVERWYRFTLFESDSTALTATKVAFKKGDGIYWDSGDHPGVIVQITEV